MTPNPDPVVVPGAGRRRTKIVCTLGPVSSTPEILADMLVAGMDVARFNLSHGSHAEHAARLAALRSAEVATGLNAATMFDLRGPEVRLLLAGGAEQLAVRAGDVLDLPETTCPGLRAALRPGMKVLLADGAVTAEIVLAGDVSPGAGEPAGAGQISEVDGLRFRLTSSGILRQRSKVVLPGVSPDLPAISDEDCADVAFGVQAGADIFAMSFVREARDVLELRELLRSLGSGAAVVAKIETRAGYDNLPAILAVSDGAMVARGDLGVECSFEEVPLMQKEILALCLRQGKPGITATEMLESMTRQPRPTRAEASDVYNAVLDGTDAVMLSGETAIGDYAVEAVEAMHRLAVYAERVDGGRAASGLPEPGEAGFHRGASDLAAPPVAIAGAAVWAANSIGASAIITPTRSGYTARMVARLRPRAPIIAVSPDLQTTNLLRLSWGVSPLHRGVRQGTDPIETALEAAAGAGLIGSGDLVVITAGVPSGVPGTTNMLQLRTIGEILARGTGIVRAAASELTQRGAVSGPLCVADSLADLEGRFEDGCVLAAVETGPAWVPYMRRAAAVLTEEGGLSSHAAVVCLSLGRPVVVGVRGVTSLPDGQVVTVDAGRGVVYSGRVRPV